MEVKSHYFINKEHSEKDFFKFTDYFLNTEYEFNSCSDVFSKNNIDYGSKVLLQTVIKKLNLSGSVLDVGCGYGVIGIVLSKHFNIDLTMIDINETAVELSKQNCKVHNVSANVLVSNLYQNVNQTYNHIVTNPPIKAGKQNLFNVVINAKNVLNQNGTITLVIKKKHGMESLKNQMQSTFNNVEVLKRDSGYYILHSIKTD